MQPKVNPNPKPREDWNALFYPTEGYQYFAAGAFRPGLKTLDYTNAGWAADAAMLAYGRSGPNLINRLEFVNSMKKAGFEHHALLGNWSGGPHGSQGFFAYSRDFAIVSFRGTEKDDPHDLISDILAAPVADPDGQGCRVHDGFKCALDEIWDDARLWLQDYRAAYPQSEICFTGHSLGAALATLAFSRFGDAYSSLYTFGCPRVGNAAFEALVKGKAAAGLGAYRFVHNRDLVTHVPPAGILYAHCPQALYFIHQDGRIEPMDKLDQGKIVEIEDLLKTGLDALRTICKARLHRVEPEGPPEPLRNHSPGWYCYRIWEHALTAP